MDASSLLTMAASECSCEGCQSACTNKPGWFAPGEAEKAAEHLGMTLQEFFDKYLVVDTWYGDNRSDGKNIYVLSPSFSRATPGEMAPAVNAGTCIFFENGKCSIHPAKPLECRIYDHTKPHEKASENHMKIMELWKDHQSQPEQLLGKKPDPPKPTLFDALEIMLMGGWGNGEKWMTIESYIEMLKSGSNWPYEM